MVILSACTQSDDLALYKTNLEIVQKAMACYETPQDYETFASLVHADVEHQSPVYGQGKVGYDGVLGQAKFYMEGFSNVAFENAVWLPGVDTTSYTNDGSVRVYGTWHYNHKASGKVLETKYYGVFQFNEEGKIAYDLEWFDLGGIFAQLQE